MTSRAASSGCFDAKPLIKGTPMRMSLAPDAVWAIALGEERGPICPGTRPGQSTTRQVKRGARSRAAMTALGTIAMLIVWGAAPSVAWTREGGGAHASRESGKPRDTAREGRRGNNEKEADSKAKASNSAAKGARGGKGGNTRGGGGGAGGGITIAKVKDGAITAGNAGAGGSGGNATGGNGGVAAGGKGGVAVGGAGGKARSGRGGPGGSITIAKVSGGTITVGNAGAGGVGGSAVGGNGGSSSGYGGAALGGAGGKARGGRGGLGGSITIAKVSGGTITIGSAGAGGAGGFALGGSGGAATGAGLQSLSPSKISFADVTGGTITFNGFDGSSSYRFGSSRDKDRRTSGTRHDTPVQQPSSGKTGAQNAGKARDHQAREPSSGLGSPGRGAAARPEPRTLAARLSDVVADLREERRGLAQGDGDHLRPTAARPAVKAAGPGQSSSQVEEHTLVPTSYGGSDGLAVVGRLLYGPDDKRIGKVEDVILVNSREQNVALLIGVGGFLGLGGHDVVVPLDQVRVAEGNRLTTSIPTITVVSARP
jgi:hypothetical protein